MVSEREWQLLMAEKLFLEEGLKVGLETGLEAGLQNKEYVKCDDEPSKCNRLECAFIDVSGADLSKIKSAKKLMKS